MDEDHGKKENSKSTSLSKKNGEPALKSNIASQKSVTTKNKTKEKSQESTSGQSNSMFNCLSCFSSISSAQDTLKPSSPSSCTLEKVPLKKQALAAPIVRQGPASNDNMVRLNVYGLTSLNQVIRYTGLGIYHSGIQVYGVEWAYGGYPHPVSSIFRMKQPRDLASLSDINGRFHFVESIEMGETHFTYEEIKVILTNLGKKDWIGTNYHLLYRNCNDFTNELAKVLCNKPIPSWVNRLAWIFSKFPFLIKMIPDEYFTPVALQAKLKQEQELKYKLSKTATVLNQKQVSREKAYIIKRKTSVTTVKVDQAVNEFPKTEISKSQSTSLVKQSVERSVSLKGPIFSEIEKSVLSVKSFKSVISESIEFKMPTSYYGGQEKAGDHVKSNDHLPDQQDNKNDDDHEKDSKERTD